MAKHKNKKNGDNREIPAAIVPEENAPTVRTKWGSFDLEDPRLPDWVEERALRSGGYPYDAEMPDKDYARELETLQIELAKLQLSVN